MSTVEFDLEDFCTFLAANLMGGPSKIKEKFESIVDSTLNNKNKSFSLYWKSPMMVETMDPVSTKATDNDDDDDDNRQFHLVFVDATFTFQVQLVGQNYDNNMAANTCVSVAFGACLCRNGTKECFYLRNPTLTQKMLHDHVDQHSILLEETRSHVIAKQMAEALLDLGQRPKPISVKTVVVMEEEEEGQQSQQSNDNIRIQQVDIPLRYENGAEISHLSIVDSSNEPVSKMSPNVASILFSNIYSHDETKQKLASSNDNNGDDDDKGGTTELLLDSKSAKEVKQSQQQWAKAAIEGMEAEEKARKARLAAAATASNGDNETNQSKSKTTTGGPKDSTDQQNKQPKSSNKRPKVRHGMMRLAAPAAKKRAKKTGGGNNPFGPPKKK